MCRRARRHEGRSELPGGQYTPLLADHVANAFRHAQNAQKIADVGVDMFSEMASQFASMLYPQPPADTSTSSSNESSATDSPPAAAPAAGNLAPTTQPPTSSDVASQSDIASPTKPQAAATPASVDRNTALIEDDIDDDDYVQVPIVRATPSSTGGQDPNSSASSIDSVERDLMESTKETHLQK